MDTVIRIVGFLAFGIALLPLHWPVLAIRGKLGEVDFALWMKEAWGRYLIAVSLAVFVYPISNALAFLGDVSGLVASELPIGFPYDLAGMMYLVLQGLMHTAPDWPDGEVYAGYNTAKEP